MPGTFDDAPLGYYPASPAGIPDPNAGNGIGYLLQYTNPFYIKDGNSFKDVSKVWIKDTNAPTGSPIFRSIQNFWVRNTNAYTGWWPEDSSEESEEAIGGWGQKILTLSLCGPSGNPCLSGCPVACGGQFDSGNYAVTYPFKYNIPPGWRMVYFYSLQGADDFIGDVSFTATTPGGANTNWWLAYVGGSNPGGFAGGHTIWNCTTWSTQPGDPRYLYVGTKNSGVGATDGLFSARLGDRGIGPEDDYPVVPPGCFLNGFRIRAYDLDCSSCQFFHSSFTAVFVSPPSVPVGRFTQYYPPGSGPA